MRTTIFAIAAGLVAVTASAASAMPAVKAAHAADGIRDHNGVAIEHIDYSDRKRMLRKKHWDRGHHRGMRHRGDWDDRRYSAYHGWNRYDSRPYN